MSNYKKASTLQDSREHLLRVQYHPGFGSGGTDEILRPTLMTVGDQGRCYRMVKETFGKRESDLGQTGGGVVPVSGEGSVDDHACQDPQLPPFQGQ